MSTVIGEYTLLTEFTTAGGGQSRWAFAERKGDEYFLKEFLKPKYPVDGAPGSSATKEAQREACAAFERHHRAIQKALRPLSSAGGNLVVTTDFFRAHTRYYKVTEKVDVTNWTTDDVMRSPSDHRLLLMLTVAHSLNVLHRAGLVHGDIKPPNILIKRVEDGGRFSAKLIDFDNAVLAKEPLPPPDQMVGDMAYYSPELVRYINEPHKGGRLSGASDIFALGLVYSEWLTGRKPDFDPDARYAGVAAARGQRLGVDSIAPAALADLIGQMVSPVPSERPKAQKVHATLRAMRGSLSEDPDIAPSPSEETPPAGGLHGSLLRKKAGESGPVEGSSVVSRLRGSLAAKRDR
jgi:eukaryotic-like serine/threonine-protein kinase